MLIEKEGGKGAITGVCSIVSFHSNADVVFLNFFTGKTFRIYEHNHRVGANLESLCSRNFIHCCCNDCGKQS